MRRLIELGDTVRIMRGESRGIIGILQEISESGYFATIYTPTGSTYYGWIEFEGLELVSKSWGNRLRREEATRCLDESS